MAAIYRFYIGRGLPPLHANTAYAKMLQCLCIYTPLPLSRPLRWLPPFRSYIAAISLFYVLISSLIFSFSYAANETQLLQQDEQALLNIKAVLSKSNPHILNTELSTWISNSSNSIGPCQWSRVECNTNSTRVIGIDLSSLNMSGNLSAGPAFSSLTALSFLNISNNSLDGAITDDIAECTGLTRLDLSSNKLTSSSTNLTMLSNLQYLNLGDNKMNNSLSLAIPLDCTHLNTLNLSNNAFIDISSDSWAPCASLQTVDLSHNQLTGSLPVGLTTSPMLEYLSISDNNLTGLPSSLCTRDSNPALTHLDISDNSFNGTFPLSLINCSSLKHLDLSGNQFTGNISSDVANLTSLTILNLSENRFTGTIPKEIGRLTSLTVFMAGSNSLHANVPLQLANCSGLVLLDLNGNQLTGNLPDFFDQMLSLQYVVLHSNNFSGSIPPSFFNISKLEFLDLSNNSLSGTISQQFSTVPGLQFLLLAANNFSGVIPPEFGNMSKLQFLDLSSNRLTGQIPSSLGRLQDLLWLMLADNLLSGEIPSQLGNCSSLLWLNLKKNMLTGTLPPQLATMGQNVSIIMAQNRQRINPPKAFGECLMIKRWIPEDYPPYSFQYDILDSTRCKSFWIELLMGTPSYYTCRQSLTAGGYIQVTDNRLSGEIPDVFQANQTSILLLSRNQFSGNLPGGLGNLSLTYLNVSHNNFTGLIPDALGNNKCLTLLDLSFNNFSGPLPESIGGLSQLSRFNVSYNPLLTGSIPSVGQYLTFGPESYYNNPLLCFTVAPGMRTNASTVGSLPFCASNSSASDTTSTPTTSGSPLNTKLVIGLMMLGFSMMILSVGVGYHFLKRHRILTRNINHSGIFGSINKKGYYTEDSVVSSSTISPSDSQVHLFYNYKPRAAENEKSLRWSVSITKLTYKDIQKATNNFDESCIVGRGGFGEVYKAKLPDGTVVAIKKLIQYGEQGDKEFQSEMDTLGRLQQENLVPLLGYCTFGAERMLVYKYISNGSLEHWLHSKQGGPEMLTWPIRLRIAINCAKALRYLHEECGARAYLHRDMKSSNILLDEHFNGYLADFGLARHLDSECSHVSTVIAGTLGYVPPEYCLTWRATKKGDIYSFGVVMLELITGKQPICNITTQENINANNNDSQNGYNCDQQNLVDWVRGLDKQSRALEACHSTVKQTVESGKHNLLLKFIELALACTLDPPDQRPSMIELVKQLDAIRQTSSDHLL